MIYQSLLSIAVLFPLCCSAVGQKQIVTYEKKADLFATTSQSSVYRIPAITTCKDGSLLAFSDRRSSIQDVRADQQIDIVCRRSFDGGATWSEEQLVMGLAKKPNERNNILPVSLNEHAYSDPVVVSDSQSDKIIALCAHGYGIGESKPGTNAILQIVRVESTDGGKSWNQPQNITADFYGPDYEGSLTTDGEDPKNWKAVFAPSGKLLQLRDGRLAISMFVHTGNKTCNYVYISSDLGENWEIAGNCAADHGDEAKLEELADGTLMISSRVSYSQGTGRLYNYYAFDTNQWGETELRKDVATVNNNAEIKVLTSKAAGHSTNRMLFSFANTEKVRDRQNLCVYYSYEEGAAESWQFGKTLWAGSGDYSTMTILPDRTIGALTERRMNGSGWDYHIDYDRFSIEELTNGKDWINVTITKDFNPLTDAECNLAGIDGSLTIKADAMPDLIGKREVAVPVFDTISVERDFAGDRFYLISFPFDIEKIYFGATNSEEYELYAFDEKGFSGNLKKIKEKQLVRTELPKANTPYLFRLPNRSAQTTVSFVSGVKQQLAVRPGNHWDVSGNGLSAFAASDVLKPHTVTDVYVLNNTGTAFEWKETAEINCFSGFLKGVKKGKATIPVAL